MQRDCISRREQRRREIQADVLAEYGQSILWRPSREECCCLKVKKQIPIPSDLIPFDGEKIDMHLARAEAANPLGNPRRSVIHVGQTALNVAGHSCSLLGDYSP